MITSAKFDLLKYKYPKFYNKNRALSDLVGIDSEAYTNGCPFVFGFSDGKFCKPKELFTFLFENYPDADFAVYNLKYDSGAILYLLPKKNKIELWERDKTSLLISFHGMAPVLLKIEYIPHKHLKLDIDKTIINFWDISQYYAMSLDKAAKIYLQDSKTDIETKSFSREYVKKNFLRITDYCIKDADLCARLGNFLLKKLAQFGIEVSALYSNAYISLEYFAARGRIVTAWRYWRFHKKLLKYAIDSYEGGKFEVTARGRFDGYIYDIISAYPAQISQLIDISLADIKESREYEKDAVYGFMRAYIDNTEGRHIPCGVMLGNVRVYPAGAFYATITKQEYEYMVSIGVRVDILNGFWLFVRRKKFPYQETMAEVFALKDKYKGNDLMLYTCAKVMANGLYGKFCQILDKEKTKEGHVCGKAFNPMYASIITANVRILISHLQNTLQDKCLGVHTDSVMTTEPLPDKYLGTKLGDLALDIKGNIILIACGQYQILNDKGENIDGAYKGFYPKKGDTWEKILTENKNYSVIEYEYIKVESWVEAVSKGHFNKVNLFTNEVKKINLNVDNKRLWDRKIIAKNLLSQGLQYSEPVLYIENEPPEYWDNVTKGKRCKK